jgi:hypothetical protein
MAHWVYDMAHWNFEEGAMGPFSKNLSLSLGWCKVEKSVSDRI